MILEITWRRAFGTFSVTIRFDKKEQLIKGLDFLLYVATLKRLVAVFLMAKHQQQHRRRHESRFNVQSKK